MNIQGNKKQTVFYMGNSLMYRDGSVVGGRRFSLTSYTSILAAGKKVAAQNYSVGGIETNTMINNFSTVLAPFIKPNDVVFFWEIINDIGGGGKTAAQAYANCILYCNMCKRMGAKVIIASTIPATNVTNEQAKLDTDTLIRANWTTFADAFCDFRSQPHFQTTADAADLTYYIADGTHLTDLGYDTISNFATPIILSFL
jgi:lysophospholipase L1-like esterase